VEQPAGQLQVGPGVEVTGVITHEGINIIGELEHRLRLQVQPVGGNKGSEFPAVRRVFQIQHRLGVADGGTGFLKGPAVGVEGDRHRPVVRIHLLRRHGLVQQVQVAPSAPVGGVENAVEVLVVIRGQGEEVVHNLRGEVGLRRLPQVCQGRDRDRLRLPGKRTVRELCHGRNGQGEILRIHPVVGQVSLCAGVLHVQGQGGQIKPVVYRRRGGIHIDNVLFRQSGLRGLIGRNRRFPPAAAGEQRDGQEKKRPKTPHGQRLLSFLFEASYHIPPENS